jgi:hypothetical protein
MCTDKMFHNINLKCTVCILHNHMIGRREEVLVYTCQASLGSTLVQTL